MISTMSGLKVVPVTDSYHQEKFLEFPVRIYRHDRKWVRPLDRDIDAVFNRNKNSFYRHGEAVRWLIQNEMGELLGRVAAFINYDKAYTYAQPTGGMGFFECVDDEEVASELMNACEEWLTANGMEAMDGPINFGENNAWWGLVVDGFQPPLYRGCYNPPYYQEFFENHGFQTYFEQYYYQFDIRKGLADRYYKFAQRLASRCEYTCRNLEKNNLDFFADAFRYVYNKGWKTHDNFKEMTRGRVHYLFNSMKPILDEDLICFLFHQDQPIGFIVMLPELNQITRHFDGQFGLLEKLELKLALALGKCKVAYGSVFGFIPEYQNKGLETLLFYHLHHTIVQQNNYTKLAIGWVGDFNPRVINLYQKLGFQYTQKARTYRKLFNPDQQFERAPIIH